MSNQYNTNLFSIVPIGGHTRNFLLGSPVVITIPANATGMLVQAGDQNVKYTINGTSPDVNVGFMLRTTDVPARIDLFPGAKITFVEAVAGASINYQLFRSV